MNAWTIHFDLNFVTLNWNLFYVKLFIGTKPWAFALATGEERRVSLLSIDVMANRVTGSQVMTKGERGVGEVVGSNESVW